MSETATQSGDTPTSAGSKAGDTDTATGSNGGESQPQLNEQQIFDRAFAKVSTKFEAKLAERDKVIADLQGRLQKDGDAQKTAEELRAELDSERASRSELAGKLQSYEDQTRERLLARAEKLAEPDRELVNDFLESKDFARAEKLLDRFSTQPAPTTSQHGAVTQTKSGLAEEYAIAKKKANAGDMAPLRALYEKHSKEDIAAAAASFAKR